jgi:hypothetical protein
MPEKTSKLAIKYVSLMNQCWHVFVEAQRVWKYYLNGYKSPYDKEIGWQLQPDTMPSRWIIDSVPPHKDLIEKTLESVYKGDFDWQPEMERALKLFRWCSKPIFKIMDSDKQVEVAVNQARCNIFGRNSNSEKELTDEEILACFAMHVVLDAKIRFNCDRGEGTHSTLGDDNLAKARSLLELAKSGCETEKSVIEPIKNVYESDVGLEGKRSEGRAEHVDKKDITPKILFMDDKKNALYFDKKKIVTLEPEEMKLIEYLRKQDAFELKQILTEHFEINLTETYKHSKNIAESLSSSTTKPTIEEKDRAISKADRNRFDTYKSNINKKCKTLEIGDLIVKHGDIKKAFKLSVKITKKTLQL